jgi:hypothetical protein
MRTYIGLLAAAALVLAPAVGCKKKQETEESDETEETVAAAPEEPTEDTDESDGGAVGDDQVAPTKYTYTKPVSTTTKTQSKIGSFKSLKPVGAKPTPTTTQPKATQPKGTIGGRGVPPPPGGRPKPGSK